MHGAALTHILFLPRHAGVIELFPYLPPGEEGHFRTFSKWRGLHYTSWKNRFAHREMDSGTIVNPHYVKDMVKTTSIAMGC